ncbi:MAG: AAA family ATPase [Desulfobacterales bacterium]|nr:AAA family ATPase [Desulfobacterales bacterium]
MKKLPYAIANFLTIRKENYLYIDRTSYIRKLENMSGNSFLFVRPRRFGKSLWLNVLKRYYDLALADSFDTLFGDLDIGKNPSPLRNRYFVMTWNFSRIDPRGTVDEIAEQMNRTFNNTIENFLMYYSEYLSDSVKITPMAADTLENVLSTIAKASGKLYLLIDEYDNFANEVMATDEATYKGLVRKEGPLKTLYKALKDLMENNVLDRMFVTGVSPVVMSDITSGANIFKNLYLRREYSALCGFTQEEVTDILTGVAEHCGLPESSVKEAGEMMNLWYNGSRFSADSDTKVYNPTLVFYFLDYYMETCQYPRQMLDSNLAADEGKLEYMGRAVSGRQAVKDIFQKNEPFAVSALADRFTLSAMLDRAGQDNTFLVSYLYYFGMLTISGRDTRGRICLSPPNLVTEKLYSDQILCFLLPLGAERNKAAETVDRFVACGELQPLLEFTEKKIFPVFSNRDYRWMNEFAVKMAFTAMLFNDITYALFSEPELSRGYADLCLIIRPDARKYDLFDMLFEFKYVSLKKLKLSGKKVRGMTQTELLKKQAVKEAFEDAESQVRNYADILEKKFGKGLRLKTYTVVSVGFDRLLGREI